MIDALKRRWDTFFFTGFSAESLGLLRMWLGVGLLFFHVMQFESLAKVRITGPGFVYLEPIWYFQLLGIQQDVPWLNPIVFALLIAATVSMIVGRWTRSSIVLMIVCIFYLKGVRDSYTGDVHHRYLIPMQLLFLLLLSKCGQVLSRDARRAATKAVPMPSVAVWEASWPIKAMQLYVASFYLWSIIAKIRVAGWAWFENGERLQNLLLKRSVMWGVGPDGVPLGNESAFWLAHQETLLMVLARLTLVMEFGFPLLLFIRDPRLRFYALLGVTVFHVANFLLLYVGFLFLPIVFLVFFDLVPVRDSFRVRWR
jgi:hypothetical protein